LHFQNYKTFKVKKTLERIIGYANFCGVPIFISKAENPKSADVTKKLGGLAHGISAVQWTGRPTSLH